MANKTKILIVILVVISLSGGFLVYNRILAPKRLGTGNHIIKKSTVSKEEPGPRLTISAPSEIEVIAYKDSSFDFSVKNEGHQEVTNININLMLDKNSISVTPNNVIIFPGEFQNFRAKLNKLKPGSYNLYLKISGEPNIKISKTIPLKSQIVVGLEGYHNYGGSTVWKKEFECGGYHSCTGGNYVFVKYLNDNNIKTKVIESPLSSEILKGINTLVIVAPSIDRPFSSDEIAELKNFLNNNGGLLLVAPFNGDITNLSKLIDALHLNVKITERVIGPYGRSWGRYYEDWTQEITKHPVTLGIDTIMYAGDYILDIRPPMISLVELKGGPIIFEYYPKGEGRKIEGVGYAIQYYANGKIGIIGSDSVLNYGERCHQCQKLLLNLIKWLATPEVYEEKG